MPGISVIIPLYNKSPHIRKTLESVFAQSVPPHEIIVVDDGSTDGGAEIVAGLEHPRLQLVKQANLGVSAARNTGIKQATGDYVAFLDADDTWEPFHLEELARLITVHPGSRLFSTMISVSMGGLKYYPTSPFPAGTSGPIDDFCRSYANHLSMITSSTACAHRESILLAGGFPEGVRRGEDVIAWVKMAHRDGMVHSSRVTAVYDRDATNRVANLPDTEAPPSLVFLSDLLSSESAGSEAYSGVALLFSRIAFNTCAHRRDLGQWAGIPGIFGLSVKSHMWWLAVKIALLALVPGPVIRYAKHLKYKNKTSQT